jgi:site-specific DNA-cytosine methylase
MPRPYLLQVNAAGLEGERSGLFLRRHTASSKNYERQADGKYPRISIWENVVGALNSNRGADFGIIIDQMAQAGALVIEWAVLDAQYFGVPQRRRRVFVIAIFDPAIANICPDPLLPVSESLPGHLTKGKPARKSAATTLTEGTGTDGAIVNSICGETYHHGGITNQDLSSSQMVVEGSAEWWDGRDTADTLTTTSNEQRMPDKHRFQAIIEQEVVGTLTVSDLVKQVNNEIIGKGLLQVVEDRQPYTPSSFAQYKEEDLNAVATLRAGGGDLGGGSEVLIAEPVAYHFDALSSNSMKSSNPESGVNKVDQARTLDTWRPDPSLNQGGLAIVEELMLIDGTRVDDVRVYEEPVQTLKERMETGGNNVPMLAHAVAYDEYNDTTNKVHQALRAGTKQSTGVLFESEVAATLRSGGDGGVPSSRGEHLVTEPTMAVRRLTPLEAERLMGWPDDHTRYKADGTEQADTHRYKQCGNGVASPVAEWIAKHLLKL